MDNLYDKLGEDNLDLLIDAFYDRVTKSEVISHLFKTDIQEVKRKQKLFLTQFLGGDMLYSKEFGHPKMRMRHMPHKITPNAAYEWLECMKSAIISLDVSDDLKVELFHRFPKLAAHMVNSAD